MKHDASIRRFALPLLLAVICLGLTGVQRTITLGINHPLTGPYSVEGLDQIRAARMAADGINHIGGIAGRRLVLMTSDSASDPLRARLNAKQLIENGCSMLFGSASSEAAATTSAICQKYQVPYFSTPAASLALTLEKAHRVQFREYGNDHMAAQVLAGWLNGRFAGESYRYVTADCLWGRTAESSLRRATNTTDRSRHPSTVVPVGSKDFSIQMQDVAANPPKVLVLVLFGKDMAYALRRAHALGLTKTCQIVVPSLTLGMAERAGAKALEGVVGTVPWSWKIPFIYDHPRGRNFVDAFVKRFHRYPSSVGAGAYTVIHEYKNAVERAGSFRTSLVIKALEGHTFRLLKDAQTWRAMDHQNVQTLYLVRGNNPVQVMADPLRQDFLGLLGAYPSSDICLTGSEWRQRRREAGLPETLEPLAD